MQRVFIRTSLALLSILLVTFNIEIFLRIINYPWQGCNQIIPVNETPIAQFDQDLGWSLIPNRTTKADGALYIVNREGYRAPSANYTTDFSKPIILIVGDSMLFGHGLNFEDTFGHKLKHSLNNHYEVINFAVGGYGTDQMYLMLKRVFPKYRPSIVIMDTFTDHDSRNAQRDRREFSNLRCIRMIGTKPQFLLNDNILELKYKPELYSSYDSPRILLFLRNKLSQNLNTRATKYGHVLTQALIREIETYVKSHGVRLFILNIDYTNQQFSYTNETRVLGISTYDETHTYHLTKDDWHPNSTGTSMMVYEFLKRFHQELL